MGRFRARGRAARRSHGGLTLGIVDELADLRSILEPQLCPSELKRQRDQARLGAIVQVALDAPQLGRLSVNGLTARVREQIDPRPQRPSTTGDQHPVVQRDQRVGAARRGEAQQSPGRPETVHTRQQPREHPGQDEDSGRDADESPHARHSTDRSGGMSPGPAGGEIDDHWHRQPKPCPGRPERPASGHRPDRSQQNRNQAGQAWHQRTDVLTQGQSGGQRRHPSPRGRRGQNRQVR